MLTRRQLFRLLAAGLVTAPAVVDELLWTPKKTIFLPPAQGWKLLPFWFQTSMTEHYRSAAYTEWLECLAKLPSTGRLFTFK